MPSGANATGDVYGTRQGSAAVVHTYPFDYTFTPARSVARFKGSPQRPIQLEFFVLILVAFNGATNGIAAGFSGGSGNYLDTADNNPTVPGYYPAANAASKYRVDYEAEIVLSYIRTGTPTAGQAVLIIKEFSENRNP